MLFSNLCSKLVDWSLVVVLSCLFVKLTSVSLQMHDYMKEQIACVGLISIDKEAGGGWGCMGLIFLIPIVNNAKVINFSKGCSDLFNASLLMPQRYGLSGQIQLTFQLASLHKVIMQIPYIKFSIQSNVEHHLISTFLELVICHPIYFSLHITLFLLFLNPI